MTAAASPDPATSPSPTLRSRWPLRVVLVVPFLVEVFIAVGVTGYLSIRDGRRAVDTVAGELRQEITARIEQKLTDYFNTAHAINAMNADALQRGHVNPDDLPMIAAHFQNQVQSFDSVDGIFWGNAAGDAFVGIWKFAPDRLLWMEAGAQFNGAIRFFELDAQGQPAALVNERPDFVITERPWYQAAVAKNEQTWGDIFAYHAAPVIALSASMPVYDQQGTFLGVIGNNFLLPQISTFLKTLNISQAGQAFIIERSGLVVASSALPQPFLIDEAGVTHRFLAAESSDPVMRATMAALQAQFGDWDTLTTTQQFVTEIEQQRQYIQVSNYRDQYGLDWLMVVVVPETEFMGQIIANRQRTIWLCLLASVGAGGLGVLTARRIARPLHTLLRASQQMALGEMDTQLQPSAIAEIHDLGMAFEQMRQQLRESLATLEERVAERTAALQHINDTLEQELTHRRQVEIALQKSESQYRAIVEDQTEFICRCDAEGRLTFANEAFGRYFGRPVADFMGQSLFPLIPAADQEELQAAFALLQPSQPVVECEHRAYAADGSIRWQQWRIRAIWDEAGRILEYQAVGQDIHDRRRAEERLQRNAAMDRAIAALVDRIRQSLDIQDIFTVTAEETRQILDCDRVAIYQFHPNWSGKFVAESVAPPFEPLLHDGVVTQWRDPDLQATQGGRYRRNGVLQINDVQQLQQPLAVEGENFHLAVMELFAVRACVITPVFVKDQLWGLLHIYQHRSPRDWHPDEVKLLQKVGNQLGIALKQADLLTQVRQQSRELQEAAIAAEAAIRRQLDRQAETARAVDVVVDRTRSSLDVETIFTTVTQEARHLLHCDRVMVYQFHADWSGEFVAEAISPNERSLLVRQAEDDSMPLSISNCSLHGLVEASYFQRPVNDDLNTDTVIQQSEGEFIKQRDSFVAHDIYAMNFSSCYIQALESYGVRAYISAPVFEGDRLWGLLAAYQRTVRDWEPWEVKAMIRLGKQLGIALQQAEYVHEIQEKSAQIVQAVQAEAAMKQAKEAADAANLAKSEFLSHMSHELRTPLNAILGFAQLLRQDPALSELQRDRLTIINQSGEHLLGLINDILDMSKIESGQSSLHLSQCDLPQLLETIYRMLDVKAVAKGITLLIDCHAQIPRCVMTDAGKLRQILINIVGNAIKFTSVGHVILRVRSQPLPPQSDHTQGDYHLQFEIEDTGPGIAPEEAALIFSPFAQTEVGRQSNQGSGLGLTISQQFARLMGGEITFICPPSGGTIFTVDIYVNQCDEISLWSAIGQQHPIALAPGQPAYRILVVDDNRASRDMLCELIAPVGFEVRTAENGQVALEQWQQWQPHLIWMDIRMPVLDGLAATRQIKATAQGQAPVIIALTASSFESDRQSILAAGCDDFVGKPFQTPSIFEKMTEYLGVEYLYQANESHLNLTAISSPDQLEYHLQHTLQQLQEMPVGWLTQLRHAIASADVETILGLVSAVPSDRQIIATTITTLAEQYAFDELMELMEEVAVTHL